MLSTPLLEHYLLDKSLLMGDPSLVLARWKLDNFEGRSFPQGARTCTAYTISTNPLGPLKAPGSPSRRALDLPVMTTNRIDREGACILIEQVLGDQSVPGHEVGRIEVVNFLL